VYTLHTMVVVMLNVLVVPSGEDISQGTSTE